MTTGDVDAFLLAKRQIKALRYATSAIVAILLIGFIVAITSHAHDAFWSGMLSGTVVGAVALVFQELIAGPRDRLLEVVERQINSDPDALRYLASRRAPN